MIARLPRTVSLIACLLMAWPASAIAAEELPAKIAVPPEKPSEKAPDEALPPTAPIPEQSRPEQKPAPQPTPPDAPVPEAAPSQREPETAADERPSPPVDGSNPALMPAGEVACRAELSKLGVVFKDVPVPEAKGGCALPFPVEISALPDGVKIEVPIVVNCATALTTAKFVRDVINPAAKEAFKTKLRSFAQASGYVCRPRNGTKKLSEHAFGNAIDIASFTLANDKVIAVEPAPSKENEDFLRKVSNAACGPFKTVLGPGSNADHALHFHFDLAQRRNGGTYCK